ncbi:hypothetical protein K503DRAFT_853323 [Rhizopogon vinicolor AM-OR11-026]|uniref:Protein CPL1-like domain-containing protein n=1 Tax=Rhizopogon vinicolor AM-OR11-026 TaxID=1314800 RepID=A0A1B7NF05_9AGAM|nr:hypothetical protein K503DRAFT_853323 [Rhizopogon vinicolor AM-OR11-026]
MKLSAFAISILSVSTAFALSKSSRPYIRTLAHDVCSSINSDLVLNEVIDKYGKATVAGHLEACLCLSAVGAFVESNSIAQAGVKLLGDRVGVEAIISGMIKALPNSQCTYPDHAHALCTDSNPCDFKCTDGYLEFPPDRPTSCKCPDHLMECDGKCGHFERCPSKALLSRRSVEPQCALGLTMYGIAGTSTGQPWKCIDVNIDPTACGGCVQAAPFGNTPVNGVNCKDIEGVNRDTVTCCNGRCIVNDCVQGFFVAPDNDYCIQPRPATTYSSGSTEDGKVSRDEHTAGLARGAGITNPPVCGLTGDVQAPPAGSPIGGAQDAGASTPVGCGSEGTAGGAMVTRDVDGSANPILAAAGGIAAGAHATSDRLLAGVKHAAGGLAGGVKATRDIAGGVAHGVAEGLSGGVEGNYGVTGMST